jgi:hypothetical protein
MWVVLFRVVDLWGTFSSVRFILFSVHWSLFTSIITSVQRSKHTYSVGNHKPFTIHPVQLSAKRNVSADRYHVWTIQPTRRCFCLVLGRWTFGISAGKPTVFIEDPLGFSSLLPGKHYDSRFQISPCFECCILSCEWFPGVWILCGDVSEHSVCSNFIGSVSNLHHLWI